MGQQSGAVRLPCPSCCCTSILGSTSFLASSIMAGVLHSQKKWVKQLPFPTPQRVLRDSSSQPGWSMLGFLKSPRLPYTSVEPMHHHNPSSFSPYLLLYHIPTHARDLPCLLIKSEFSRISHLFGPSSTRHRDVDYTYLTQSMKDVRALGWLHACSVIA